MEKEKAMQVLSQIALDKLGAIITDSHIVYTSGKHGSVYINKDVIYLHARVTSDLCLMLAKHFANDSVEVVIAPAVGGVILSQWIAYHLSEITGHEVLSVYAEKANYGDHFVVRRGYSKFIVGKKVLVVEDVLTTGGSVKKVITAVSALGGKVCGLGVLCNRGGLTSEDFARREGGAIKFFSLIDFKFDLWSEKDCPLCAQGVPVNTEVGKGKEFLMRKEKAG